MKRKHLLVAGGLTTLAAITLLTLVVPQPAEAGPSFYCFTCGTGDLRDTFVESRKSIKTRCQTFPDLYCTSTKNGNLVCSGSNPACPQ